MRSFNGSASGDSNVDLATTVIFTNTLTPGVTTIKAIDFTELRTAADAVARLAGQALGGYTDPTLDSSVTVKAIHFTQIKSKINTALTTLGFPLISAADPVAAVTTITAAPLLEARSRVQ